MTALLTKCGYDTGTNLKHAGGDSPWHGKEWWPAFEALSATARDMGVDGPKVRENWWTTDPEHVSAAREKHAAMLQGLDWPQLVKYPGHHAVHLWDIIDPDFVVIMMRNPENWAHAFRRENVTHDPDQLMQATDDLIERTQHRPYAVVDFEIATESVQVAWEQMQGVPRLSWPMLRAAHQDVTMPHWVGPRARKTRR